MLEAYKDRRDHWAIAHNDEDDEDEPTLWNAPAFAEELLRQRREDQHAEDGDLADGDLRSNNFYELTADVFMRLTGVRPGESSYEMSDLGDPEPFQELDKLAPRTGRCPVP